MQRVALIAALALAAVGAVVAASQLGAQSLDPLADPEATRAALERALSDQQAAQQRAIELERDAENSEEAVERTASERAAVAARIQESEAALAAAEARLGLLRRAQESLRTRLSQREQPVVRLTGALQKFARRPLAISVLRPGSLRDAVYLRAMLSSTVPLVAARTRDLRADLARGRELEREAQAAAAQLAAAEAELVERRTRLARLEARQRLELREAAGAASRESDRAIALAERARDLEGLVGELERAGALRDELAALPGPRLRPADGTRPSATSAATATPTVASSANPGGGVPDNYQLPVDGPIAIGFGAPDGDGTTSRGVTFIPRAAAQVVAPGAGRVAFAGPYRGFGRIVIIEHGGGWTSLVTGLLRSDVEVGEDVVSGAPLGVAGTSDPRITLELRREGEAVNPLTLVR